MEFYVWKKFKNLEKQENFYSFKRIFIISLQRFIKEMNQRTL